MYGWSSTCLGFDLIFKKDKFFKNNLFIALKYFFFAERKKCIA